jgi:TPR repeat protein
MHMYICISHSITRSFTGIILNEGLIDGIDANPDQATIWWRRCIDMHTHIQATYELAVAFYTGEGVSQHLSWACDLFYKAANLGHAGAAYMLGECLLDGVGIQRDRGDALEWLVTAADLGHRLARQRVIYVLQQEYEDLDAGMEDGEESLKWVNDEHEDKMRVVNIEKSYTIGGGSRNPIVLANRKTKVMESRDQREIGMQEESED